MDDLHLRQLCPLPVDVQSRGQPRAEAKLDQLEQLPAGRQLRIEQTPLGLLFREREPCLSHPRRRDAPASYRERQADDQAQVITTPDGAHVQISLGQRRRERHPGIHVLLRGESCRSG